MHSRALALLVPWGGPRGVISLAVLLAACSGGGSGSQPAAVAADIAPATAADAGATADSPASPPVSTDYAPPTGAGAWATVDPSAAGFSPTGLEALRDVVQQNDSSSFMILVGGRILVEWYFKGADASTRLDVASVQKSVTSTLVGLARDRALLDLDDHVSDYLPVGWSNATPAQEGAITLRHLMTHSSGLSPVDLRRVAAPGTVFDYNTPAYQKLRPVLETAAGMDINALSRAWLFDAIGVQGGWADRGEVDPTGAPIWGLLLSARDMARFGLFAQRSGVWAGQPIASPGWFAEAWTPAATKADYGLLWWLQGRGTLRNKAPVDLVSALGARDQKIYVVPSLELVVTRQGLAAGAQTDAESNFDLVLLKAIADAREAK